MRAVSTLSLALCILPALADHLIPLELGGAPTDERNLWPEPLRPADGWNAQQKDDLEGVLNKRVCRGEISLAFAQREIARSSTNLFFHTVRHGFVDWPDRPYAAERR